MGNPSQQSQHALENSLLLILFLVVDLYSFYALSEL